MSETRLLFHPEGLALAGTVVALVGAAAFWGILVHWLIRTRSWPLAPLLLVPPVMALVGWLKSRSPEAGPPAVPGGEDDVGLPILPWWQVLVGLVLAGVLWPLARAAGEEPETGLQLALLAVLAATAVVWVLFFYLRIYFYLGRLPLAILLGMRVLAVILLILLIFKPTLSFEERVEHRTDLYVLIDASKSMSVKDWPDTPHRMAQATKQVEDYLERLRTAFNVKLSTFDTRAAEADPDAWPEPTGEATNLARGLKDALASSRPAETTGVILLSDGIHNAGGDVVEEVAATPAMPAIYAVGVGTDLTAQSGYQDISIKNVRAPAESVVNNVARLTVDVEAIGLADRSVEVQLREEGTLLAAEPLRLDAVAGAQSVTLTVTPTEIGQHTYEVAVPTDPAERRSENNVREVHLLVTDPKIRVLYIEGVVRPEYKPLKSVLETDPNVELLSLVQVRRGEFLQSGSLQGLTLASFPRTLDDMRKFDVYILGDLDRSYFQARQFENLKVAISEGRGLLMTGGYNSFGPGGYAGTPMEDILPVSLGSRDIGQETTPFVLKLTPEGKNHPIFFGTGDFFQYGSDTPREELPYLRGCTRLGRPKPGASVLAVHPTRTGPAGPLVVLAVQSYGRGRTAAFAADTTYQWYLPFKALGRDSPYVKFWSQMVRWLADKEIKERGDEPGVTLLVRKPYYEPGEKVLVRAKVRAEEGRATNFAEVRGSLLGPAEADRKNFGLPLAPGGVGVYETEIEPPDPGDYKVLVEARKDGERLGIEETAFSVGRPNQEFERLSIDRDVLKQLAQATGGAYYEPAAFGDLVETLRARTIKEDIHREIGVRDAIPVLFVVFLAIVTGEWLIRKYYQLN